ncbi:endolytic transglycosylase MltG, partial [Eggerthella lenta]|nr:endolytic transglycosylase MltG [Eggerthella lenta]
MPHFTKQQIRRQNIVTLLVILILIVSGLIAHGWFNHELLPVDADDQTRRVVVIPKGTTDKQAGTLLKKQKLVRNAYVFDYYLQTHKTQGIKAGRFYLK